MAFVIHLTKEITSFIIPKLLINVNEVANKWSKFQILYNAIYLLTLEKPFQHASEWLFYQNTEGYVLKLRF
jgi:hypothetical protein